MDSMIHKEDIKHHVAQFWDSNPEGVVVILGPTASGKTALSVALCELFSPAEVLSADSRQVYKHGSIASGKATPEEMKDIPHHGLNLLDPQESMNAWEFGQYAEGVIDGAYTRGARVVICGGTMLWLDGITQGYVFTGAGEKQTKTTTRPYLLLGLWWDREALYRRINARCRNMLQQGIIQEAQEVLSIPNAHHNIRTMVGYPDIDAYMRGLYTYTELERKFCQRTRNYAKRQYTWWRGRSDIVWIKMQDKEE